MKNQLLVLAGAVLVHSAALVAVDIVDARPHHQHEHHPHVISRIASAPVVAARCQVVTPAAASSVAPAAVAADPEIRVVDATHRVVTRSLVDRLIGSPTELMTGARIVPAMRDGKPDGFKLYAIRPDSIYARLGLLDGDTLESVNGFDLTSADNALTAYSRLGDMSIVELRLTRHGIATVMDYEVESPANPASAASPRPITDAFVTASLVRDRLGRTWVARDLATSILANPVAVANDARVIPVLRNGMPEGLKLDAIRVGSLFAQLGFQNGDIILAINGVAMTSPEHAMAEYSHVQTANIAGRGASLDVGITRDGKPATIAITIR